MSRYCSYVIFELFQLCYMYVIEITSNFLNVSVTLLLKPSDHLSDLQNYFPNFLGTNNILMQMLG